MCTICTKAVAVTQYKMFLYREMLNTKMCYYINYINHKLTPNNIEYYLNTDF